MKFPAINTRSIVILGYCLLVTLAISGIAIIYLEVIKSHQQSQDQSDLKKELIDLSNTLTTMYQTEETASLLAFAENEKLKIEYDSLTNRVFNQIDSLRLISNDEKINLGLDSLSILLSIKRDNALEVFKLTKQIDRNVIQEIQKRTTITKNNIDELNSLLAEVTQVKKDTTQIVGEKKGFFQRLRDVVNPHAVDTLTQISKSSTNETTEFEVPVLSDTIIDFFRQIDENIQRKNSKIVQQLLDHQQELYAIKELTGMQINKIMDAILDREYQMNTGLLKEKNESLKRSSTLVAIVGLSALIIAVFFMSWTLHSLNKAQQLQQNIQEAKKHAEKLLLSREQLIYTITHDIKAPLSSIIGFLDLLMSEDTFTQKQIYYVNNMYTSASHIQDLVKNLLDFHSIEKEQPHMNSIVFSPDSLIHNIYECFLPLSEKKKLSFDLKSTIPETRTFISDPYYIRQIVNNLLSNAIKFTPEQGKVTLTSSIEGKNQWIISVIDTGYGIDAKDQMRIFEEFVRLDKVKKEVEGTGLGLTIAKKLATLLKGSIKIESQKGTGSTFTLSIPLMPVSEKNITQIEKAIDSAEGGILFVDDDQVQLNLLSELMKREDWPYVCCTSAYEALGYLKETSFDVIFTDLQIPGMEGFELLQRIRESGIHQATTIPIIAFSAGCQKSESELKAAGFTEFLLKPFHAQQLVEIIEKYTSFKRKPVIPSQVKDSFGWQKVLDFVADDQEATIKVIDSFIDETNKDREVMKLAFQKKDKEAIKQISHKMLTLLRMISAQEIVSILTDFEKGIISKEKKLTLFRLLDEIIKNAKATRQIAEEMITIHNS